MQNNKQFVLVGLSAALFLAPMATVQAEHSSGLYVGASWGAYSIKKSNLDDNDQVLKAVVGGQFNDWFALEATIVDFNKVNNAGDQFEADGKGLAAVFSMPVLTESSVFIKGGQFWWDSDASPGVALGSGSGNDLFWGLGAKFGFSEHFALRVEGERYDVSDSHINTVTVGFDLMF
jgi:hypothetical protein